MPAKLSLNTLPPLHSRQEAAEFLGVKAQTLAVWATTGRYGLPFVKIGRKAMYRAEDLKAFVASRTIGTETTT